MNQEIKAWSKDHIKMYELPMVEFHQRALAAMVKINDNKPENTEMFASVSMGIAIGFDKDGKVCRVEFAGIKEN
jgi:hypothetical protein